MNERRKGFIFPRKSLSQGIILLLALALAASSCSGLAGATPTLQPTATSLPPTNTLLPTPTDTPIPPTATYTPTLTPLPSDTPLPTDTATATQPPPTPPADQAIHIYLVQTGTGGTTGCGDSLVKINTNQWRSGNMEQDIMTALKNLLVKRQWIAGFYNPVWLSNLDPVSVQIKGGTAIVNLTGSYVRSGDPCDDRRVRDQIWATIRQFGGLQAVTVYLDGNLLGDILAARDKPMKTPKKRGG